MIRASSNSQVRYQVNFVVINKHKLAAGTNWYHGVKQQLSIVVQGIINPDPASPPLIRNPPTFSSDPFVPGTVNIYPVIAWTVERQVLR